MAVGGFGTPTLEEVYHPIFSGWRRVMDVRTEDLSCWNMRQKNLWERLTSGQPSEKENITRFVVFAHVFRAFYVKHGRFMTMRDFR